MIEESGSFRDPAGTIFYIDNRIFRRINNVGIDRVTYLEKEKILNESIKNIYIFFPLSIRNFLLNIIKISIIIEAKTTD